MIIYKTVNKINDKSYIGQDSRNESSYFGSGVYLNRAIKKYGKGNFVKEILCKCNSLEELNDKEKYYIKEYNTKVPYGYNLTDGGEGNLGWIPSNDTRKKNSEAHMGEKNYFFGKRRDDHSEKMKGKNNPMYGIRRFGKENPMYGKKRLDNMKRNRHPDVRKKVSEGLKNHIVTEETKRKIRESLIKYYQMERR